MLMVEASNHSNVARTLQVLPYEYTIRYIGGESRAVLFECFVS